MDRVTPEQRSAIMSAIRYKDTAPEMAVRRYLHSQGYRFRLHAPLPGKPDLVFSRARGAVFVHGCFWHGHGCRRSSEPKTNIEYWTKKISKNVERDATHSEHLARLGWEVFTVWECEVADDVSAATREIVDFLAKARRA